MEGFDFDRRYSVDGYGGVAWYVVGYATEWTEETWEYLGDPEGYDPDTYHDLTGYWYPDEDPRNYAYGEPEEVEDRTRVVCVMVGDDRRFTFEVDELTPLEDEDYCPECGQIGCKAYA